MGLKQIFFLCIVMCGFTSRAAVKKPLNLPVWKLELNDRTSYLIALPPLISPRSARAKPNLIPAYIRNIIKNRNTFLTEAVDAEQIQRLVLRSTIGRMRVGKDGGLFGLHSPEGQYIRDAFRRVAIQSSPWSIIFVPLSGWRGPVFNFVGPYMPPLMVGGTLIMAATGHIPKRSDPLIAPYLVKLAASANRKVAKLDSSAELMVHAFDLVEHEQLNDLIHYLMENEGKGVREVDALKVLFRRADPNKVNQLLQATRQLYEKWVEQIIQAHDQGGAAIAVTMDHLVDLGSGVSLLNGLREAGFSISTMDINASPSSTDACQPLLNDQ